MSQTPRKRCLEPDALPDFIDVQEPKRFHSEETYRFLHLPQLNKSFADDCKSQEECAPSEELVNGVMRSLQEEEIAGTSSTSNPSNSGNNSATSDISSGHAVQTLASDSGIDLCYLLQASDDELVIPQASGSVLELCLSPKETLEGLSQNLDLKSLGENWHFEDDFNNYQQFKLYEDGWDTSPLEDYMNRDFVSQSMFLGWDFSAVWTL